MSEMTAAMIEQRNEKYLSFLSTMARFHKYPVADLTSFAIEAPAMFNAVASADFWAKHFHRSISTHAKGVTLIKDGKKTVYYDVSETEMPRNNPLEVRLWQYDDSTHKKFIDAVVSGESETEKQIHIITEELVERSSVNKKSKKLLALSVEAVILERMGFSTKNATRQLARISFKEHDIPALLAETQATARIFLDAMQKSVNLQAAENVDVPENNPLLDKLGVIQSQEKIEQTPELELKSKEEPVQLGLFDSYTATQPDNANETNSIIFEEEISEPDESSSEENIASTIEFADVEPVEEISTTENETEVVDDTPIDTATDEQDNSGENIESTNAELVEENTAQTIEPADVEPVKEISAAENATEVVDDTSIGTNTDEQDSSAYDFEEMDEEEEILPSTLEKQSEVEILPVENSQSENISSEQTPEENSTLETPLEVAKPDLQTILAEDMAVIRVNSFEKNIFRKNVIAIRTLQQSNAKKDLHARRIASLERICGIRRHSQSFRQERPELEPRGVAFAEYAHR